MSGTSNVGNSQVYEAGDQRNYKDSEINNAERFKEGKPNSHQALDSSRSSSFSCLTTRTDTSAEDERSIANKLAREEKRENEPEPYKSEEHRLLSHDATLPAKAHGNEPSKGAKIDQELREEEEEYLRRKGKGDAMPAKK